MEDRFSMFISRRHHASMVVFAVFDGHNGDEAAELASLNLRDLFEKARESLGDSVPDILRTVTEKLEGPRFRSNSYSLFFF